MKRKLAKPDVNFLTLRWSNERLIGMLDLCMKMPRTPIDRTSTITLPRRSKVR